MMTIPSVSEAIAGLQFDVEWNSTIMNVTKMYEALFHTVTPQSEWDNIWAITLGYNNTAGFAAYAYAWQDNDRAASGGYAPIGPGTYTVAIIEFKGIGNGRSTLDFGLIVAGDINAMPVPATGVKGSVTVGNVPPLIEILSPQDGGYSTIPVNLTLRISGKTSWIGYSLDNQANVTFTNNLIQVSDGQHSLQVYANNTAGQMASSNITTFIADQTPPTINLAVSPSTSGDALEFTLGTYKWKYNFSASGSHAHLSNISAYFWDFGDGTNATGVMVTHEYRQPGTYNATLEVTDLAGNTAEQSTNIVIGSAPGSLPSLGLVAAVVIPVVWAIALAFYAIRFRRKTRKT